MAQILKDVDARHGYDFLRIEGCAAKTLVAIARYRTINPDGATETRWATLYGRLEQGRSVWRFDSSGTSLDTQIINTPTYAGTYFNSVRSRLE